MKILVTGAAGFIGSHLSERLLSTGNEVIGLDNFDNFYEPVIKWENISKCIEDHKFRLVQGDIRDKDCINGILEKMKFDAIIHLAAKAGVRPSIADPVGYNDVNVVGTVRLLEAARLSGVKKYVFASSSSVYGNNQKVPFSESDNVDFPISPYASTKKAGELTCFTFNHLYDMNITCLRFFTVYGPRQRPDLAIHKFTKLIDSDREIPVFGDGSMMRDFTYIDDIVDGISAAMDRCKGYNIYNLGNSHPISVSELISKIESALGKKAKKQILPKQPGDVEITFADVTKASRELGYNPKFPIDEGITLFIQWYKNRQTGPK
jgi:UDP-glucuronate 4-epimerase